MSDSINPDLKKIYILTAQHEIKSALIISKVSSLTRPPKFITNIDLSDISEDDKKKPYTCITLCVKQVMNMTEKFFQKKHINGLVRCMEVFTLHDFSVDVERRPYIARAYASAYTHALEAFINHVTYIDYVSASRIKSIAHIKSQYFVAFFMAASVITLFCITYDTDVYNSALVGKYFNMLAKNTPGLAYTVNMINEHIKTFTQEYADKKLAEYRQQYELTTAKYKQPGYIDIIYIDHGMKISTKTTQKEAEKRS
jgi:hypothetical protein